jgi:hypothetical protein
VIRTHLRSPAPSVTRTGAVLLATRPFGTDTPAAPAHADSSRHPAGHDFGRVAVSPPLHADGSLDGGVIQRKGGAGRPRYHDPVVNLLKQPRRRTLTSTRRSAGPRKARWLRELKARPTREKARQAEFSSEGSIDWMQHIDLRHISQGRDAYDKNRDGALGAEAKFIQNMASSRAFIETALKAGDELNFGLYDQLHTLTLSGAKSANPSALHPVEDGAYGYQAGQGGRIDPEVLAQTMKGEDNPSPGLDGMRATKQLPPLYSYGNVTVDPAYAMSKDERVEYVRRKQKSGELHEGAFMEFPSEPEHLLRGRLEGYFKGYEREAEKGRKADTTTERQNQGRLAVASLHQKLERSHAYADGNGRTNLALMNALLIKEGMSPAILDDPSSSHLVTTEEWARQIQKGQARHYVVKAAWDKHRNNSPGTRNQKVANALVSFDRKQGTEKRFRYQ